MDLTGDTTKPLNQLHLPRISANQRVAYVDFPVIWSTVCTDLCSLAPYCQTMVSTFYGSFQTKTFSQKSPNKAITGDKLQQCHHSFTTKQLRSSMLFIIVISYADTHIHTCMYTDTHIYITLWCCLFYLKYTWHLVAILSQGWSKDYLHLHKNADGHIWILADFAIVKQISVRAHSDDASKNSHRILEMMLGSHYTACEMLCDIFII